jgi:hypothetical protein
MSNRFTEEWLKCAKENFKQAIVEDNVPMARAIIDGLIEQGYGQEAMALQREAERFNSDQTAYAAY